MNKSLRFKVFERDNFTCQYCGEKPPKVILEVDHAISRKDGGMDDLFNLITACFACNRGKSAKSVDLQKKKNKTFKKELEELEEQKEQLSAYYNFLKKSDKCKDQTLKIYQRAWEDASSGTNSLTEKGLKNIKRCVDNFGAESVFKAIKITWAKDWGDKKDVQFKYMCGVLKNIKLEKDDPVKYAKQRMAYSVKYVILNNCFGYLNENDFWRWVNDGIDLSVIEEKARELKKWTNLKEYIYSTYYH